MYKRRRLHTEGQPTPELPGGLETISLVDINSAAAASVSFPFSGLSPFGVDLFDPVATDVRVIVNSDEEDNDIDPFLDFVNAMDGGGLEDTSMWLTHGQNVSAGEVERAKTPIYEEIMEGYEKMGGSDLCVCFCLSLNNILEFIYLVSLSVSQRLQYP